MKRLDRLACAALSENRHFDVHVFRFLYNSLFRLCVVPRMTVADDSLVVALIGFALYLVTAVTLDCFDKLVGDTHDNTRVVCCAVIVRVLKKYLVTDFRIAVKSTSSFVILQREATTCAVLAGLTFEIFGFVLVLAAKLIKKPITKLVTPVKPLLVSVIIPASENVS